MRCTLGLSGNVASSTSASVDVPVHDYLLTFHTAATTGMVRFTFERTFTATAGAPAPTLVIDLFDDGIIEATGTASTPQSYDTFVFFAPIRIRVRVGASVSTSVAPAASFQLGLNVRAVPLNGVQALPALPGCGGNALQVRPAWDVDGVVLRLSPVLWQGFPYLAVFGLGTSMLTLGPPPAITPLQACVLMPSPDVVLLMPPSGEMLLPIPAAVRPIAIFTQAVVFTGSVTSLQTTDASLVLGYLNPVHLVGGALRLDAEKARAVIAERIARPLGMSVEEAAYGAHLIAASNMIRALKAVSSERGRDPREYVLVGFGGNGPVFAAGMAEAMQMRQVLIPPSAGVFSSFGLLYAEVEYYFTRTRKCLLRGVEQEARGPLGIRPRLVARRLQRDDAILERGVIKIGDAAFDRVIEPLQA